jgi:hypothetical protein
MVVWAAMLGILTAVQLQYLHLLPVLLLGGAAAGMAALAGAIALVLAARRRRAPDPLAPRALPDLSPPTVVGAVGLCALAAGAKVGAWLAIGGGGLIALAAVLLARELRGQRRLERAGGAPPPASEETGP